jgi:hypothetical protein
MEAMIRLGGSSEHWQKVELTTGPIGVSWLATGETRVYFSLKAKAIFSVKGCVR